MTDLAAYQGTVLYKLILIYLLNLADWLCTAVLLHTGGFFEANPLMNVFIGEPAAAAVLKGLLPALVILGLSRLLGRLDSGGLQQVDRCAAFVLTLYFMLCTAHLMNFVILFLR